MDTDNKKLKILMLEDNPEDAFLIERVLRKDDMVFLSERVDTRDEFCEAITRFKPDVVLSDHGLPSFNSREALKICLKERATTPFILVTGTMSDENAISCLRDGADDYLLKGNLSRLPSAIRRALKDRRLQKLKREARYALRKQNTELVKVNSELDNFVYSVSHNLRGPLASVMGLLNIAQKKTGDVSHLHELMLDSVKKLDETLKEILEYSNNARTDVAVSEVNWKQVAETAYLKLNYLKNFDRGVSIVKETGATFPFYSDPGRLEVILCSLYSNSINYCDLHNEGKIETTIDVAWDEATITVQDNGIGIAKDKLPNVCNMFYRATERSSGAGLGLYIVKETVKKLGGQLTIDSKEGQGAVVTITLPNRQSEVNQPGEAA